MTAVQDFIVNNIWLCVGVGALIVLVADEVFGITRELFGDEIEDRTQDAKAKARRMRQDAEAEDPLDHLDRDSGGSPIEDLIGRR